MEEVKKSAVEAAEEKAAELSQLLGVKVHPLVFKDDNGGDVIGFIKEPNRAVKIAMLDKSIMGGFSAASEVLEGHLLREHSDPRIYSENPEHDKINIGAVMAAYDLVKFSVNQAKKKS